MARKVLVADDSVTIQKVVGLTFANENIDLTFVDNGDEAITLARELKPALVLADVLMPGKSGYEVCEAIKNDPELRHIPVLLLTGTFEPFDSDRANDVGANGTITKPFESQTLIQQVNELLEATQESDAVGAPQAGIPETTDPEEREGEGTEIDAREAPSAEAAAPASPEATGKDDWFEELMSEATNTSQPTAASVDSSPFPQEAESAETSAGIPGRDLNEILEDFAVAPERAESEGNPEERTGSDFEEIFDDPAFDALGNDLGEERRDTPNEVVGNGDPADSGPDAAEFQFAKNQDDALEEENLFPPPSVTESRTHESSPEPDVAPEEAASAPLESEAGAFEETVPPSEESPLREEAWNLSEFEAIDPSQIDQGAESGESDALWNEAAAEAIDIVETTTLEDDNGDTPTVELPDVESGIPEDPGPEGDRPETIAPDNIAPDAIAPDAIAPDAIADVFATFDANAGDVNEADVNEGEAGGSTNAPENIAQDLPTDPETENIALTLAETLTETIPEPGTGAPDEAPSLELDTAGESPGLDVEDLEISQISLEEAPESEETIPLAFDPASRRQTGKQEEETSQPPRSEVLPPESADIIRKAVSEAVEKVTWEAFSDLSETVVKAVQEKVEKIAWEVIPQMAESIIKDEIARLKEGKE